MSWQLPPRVEAAGFVARAPLSQRYFDELLRHGVGARLAAVGAAVPRGARVADVGTDHGALPLALVRAGIAVQATGIDQSAEALAAARSAPRWQDAPEGAALWLGDGLRDVDGAVDVVTMAGVGGDTMVEVIGRDGLLERGVRRLVLQPNNDERVLRSALGGLGWRIVAERLVAEGRRMFLVLVAESGEDAIRDDVDRIVGPCLRQGDPLLPAWLWVQRAWVRRQLAGRERAGDDAGAASSRRHLAVLDAVDVGLA